MKPGLSVQIIQGIGTSMPFLVCIHDAFCSYFWGWPSVWPLGKSCSVSHLHRTYGLGPSGCHANLAVLFVVMPSWLLTVQCFCLGLVFRLLFSPINMRKPGSVPASPPISFHLQKTAITQVAGDIGLHPSPVHPLLP